MRAQTLALVSITVLLIPIAAAEPLSFTGLAHGEVLTNQLAASHGVTVSAINPNRSHSLAAIFNTLETGTADPDLEGPNWARGNLAPDTVLGNVLIIAENNTDNSPADGILDNPDDEGNRPAGDLIFDYANAISEFGFDVVDLEGCDEPWTIDFYLNSNFVGTFTVLDVLDSSSPYYDATVEFGNNSANRIQPITAASLGGTAFDHVEVHVGGSGALDNIVPEPASLGLLAAGFLTVLRRRHG